LGIGALSGRLAVPAETSLDVWEERWDDMTIVKALPVSRFALAIEYFREEDGRWLADIPALPGVTAYGRTKKRATAAVQALALRLIADRLEHGEAVPGPMDLSFVAA
jgi:predicted RNase H-like HicB family nuclease